MGVGGIPGLSLPAWVSPASQEASESFRASEPGFCPIDFTNPIGKPCALFTMGYSEMLSGSRKTKVLLPFHGTKRGCLAWCVSHGPAVPGTRALRSGMETGMLCWHRGERVYTALRASFNHPSNRVLEQYGCPLVSLQSSLAVGHPFPWVWKRALLQALPGVLGMLTRDGCHCCCWNKCQAHGWMLVLASRRHKRGRAPKWFLLP